MISRTFMSNERIFRLKENSFTAQAAENGPNTVDQVVFGIPNTEQDARAASLSRKLLVMNSEKMITVFDPMAIHGQKRSETCKHTFVSFSLEVSAQFDQDFSPFFGYVANVGFS